MALCSSNHGYHSIDDCLDFPARDIHNNIIRAHSFLQTRKRMELSYFMKIEEFQKSTESRVWAMSVIFCE